MKIAVLGATGLVGRCLVDRAVAQGVAVRVMVRNPEKLDQEDVEICVGDYFDPRAVKELVQGVDAVLTTVGPPPGRHKELSPEKYETAMKALVQAMEEAGVKRLIHLASGGTPTPGENVGWGRRLFRCLLAPIAPLVIPSKEREVAVLTQSKLDWTSIRPPLIAPGVKGDFRVSTEATQGFRVDVDQLAAFMLDALEDETWFNTAPFVGTNK